MQKTMGLFVRLTFLVAIVIVALVALVWILKLLVVAAIIAAVVIAGAYIAVQVRRRLGAARGTLTARR